MTSNDAGVVTRRDPDTVRGPDVAYYSFARLPRETPLPKFSTVAPEVACEVRSPHDRWSQLLQKVGEYLDLGSIVVVVVDMPARNLRLFRGDGSDVTLDASAVLELPDVLPGLRVSVAAIFQC